MKAEVDAAWNSPDKVVIGDMWTATTPSGVKVEVTLAKEVYKNQVIDKELLRKRIIDLARVAYVLLCL